MSDNMDVVRLKQHAYSIAYDAEMYNLLGRYDLAVIGYAKVTDILQDAEAHGCLDEVSRIVCRGYFDAQTEDMTDTVRETMWASMEENYGKPTEANI